jgi:hypothetical protein
MSAKLTLALDKDHILTSILDVERGNKCGCFCPECGASLTAKQGRYNAKHFAHDFDSDCTGGVETAIHLFAKEIIATANNIWLPGAEATYLFMGPFLKEGIGYIRNPNPPESLDTYIKSAGLPPLFQTYYPSRANAPTFTHDGPVAKVSETIPYRFADITDVRVESRLENIVPDLIVTIDGIDVLIEIANTHFIDEAKLKKIRQNKWPTIEIDVSEMKSIDYDEIKNRILYANEYSKWIFHSVDIESRLATRAQDRFDSIMLELQYKFLEDQKKKAAQEARRLANVEKQKQEKLQKEQRRALISAENMRLGIPNLQGTEKQINWAISLREKRIKKFGLKDVYVQGIDKASDWITCGQKDQILYPTPFLFEELRIEKQNILDSAQRFNSNSSELSSPLIQQNEPLNHPDLEPQPRTEFAFTGDNTDCSKCGYKNAVIERRIVSGNISVCLSCLDETEAVNPYEIKKAELLSKLPRNCPECKIGKLTLKEMYYEPSGVYLFCINCGCYSS